jgi:hypothetical protein
MRGRLVEVGLDPMRRMVDVYSLSTPWSEIFEPVWDASRAKHSLTGSRVEDSVSNEKTGPALDHDKHLVIGMHVKTWAFASAVGAVSEHGHRCSECVTRQRATPGTFSTRIKKRCMSRRASAWPDRIDVEIFARHVISRELSISVCHSSV